MKELDTAIKTLWDADAGLGGIPLYFGRQPERSPMPYAVFRQTGSRPVEAFGARYHEEYIVAFMLFDTDKESLEDVLDATTSAFDRCTLALTVSRFLSCQRIRAVVLESPGAVELTGEVVYMARVEYRIRVDRTFA